MDMCVYVIYISERECNSLERENRGGRRMVET